jgi:hypothetical protein
MATAVEHQSVLLGTLIDEVRGMKQAIERSSASGASSSEGAASTADADDVEEGVTWGDEDLDGAGGEVEESGDDDEVELLVPGEAAGRGDGDGGSSEEDVDSDEDEEDLELAARGQPSPQPEPPVLPLDAPPEGQLILPPMPREPRGRRYAFKGKGKLSWKK